MQQIGKSRRWKQQQQQIGKSKRGRNRPEYAIVLEQEDVGARRSRAGSLNRSSELKLESRIWRLCDYTGLIDREFGDLGDSVLHF